jgi:hypothetical protein
MRAAAKLRERQTTALKGSAIASDTRCRTEDHLLSAVGVHGTELVCWHGCSFGTSLSEVIGE